MQSTAGSRNGSRNEPGRHQRRTDWPRHRPVVGCRSSGRLHDGHRDEEEPAWRAAERHLPPGGRRSAGGDSLPRNDHLGRPPDRDGPANPCDASPIRSRPPGDPWPASWPGSTMSLLGFRPSLSRAAGLPNHRICRWSRFIEAARRAYQSSPVQTPPADPSQGSRSPTDMMFAAFDMTSMILALLGILVLWFTFKRLGRRPTKSSNPVPVSRSVTSTPPGRSPSSRRSRIGCPLGGGHA